MSVADAVRRDLADLARVDARLADSALAHGALALAEGLDDPGTSLTSKSMAQKTLLDTLDRLRELAPAQQETSDLDTFRERTRKKLAAA